MNTYIEQAVLLSSGVDLFDIRNPANTEKVISMEPAHALPEGFCFLLDWDSQAIIEPVLLYLHAKFLSSGTYRPNSQKACVDDLKDWWGHLAHINKEWDKIDSEDVAQYRDVMLFGISPKTHDKYKMTTISRRVGSVLAFYDWTYRRKLFNWVLDEKEIRPSSRSTDTDAMTHTHSRGNVEVSTILPKSNSSSDDNIRPLNLKEVALVMKQLGPLPSEQKKDMRSCRNRISAELPLNSGLRVDELASLEKYQILSLTPEPDRPYGVCRLHITKTKGLKPRWIEIPNWLVIELLNYIDGERSQCIRDSRKYWCKRKADESSALLVNTIAARANVGRNVAAATLSRAFSDAIVSCGLTIRIPRINPETGVSYMAAVPAHSFHDLRHTFAVWLYHAEKSAGNSEPWKMIQSLLGHQHLGTTLNIYLRVVDSYERNVSDEVYKGFQEMRNASRSL